MTVEHFYLLIIALLLIIQVYQHGMIVRAHKEISKLWEQISIFSVITSRTLTSIMMTKKQEDDAQKKE
jgi:hypothetical protein